MKNIKLILIIYLLICEVSFATEYANKNKENTNIKQTSSYKELQNSIRATQTRMPINDMYGVKNKVIQSQNAYQKAREAQFKQIQEYGSILE